MDDDRYHTKLHEELQKGINSNSDRLNNHSDRLKCVETQNIRTDTILENLCLQISDLVSTVKWAGTFIIMTLVGFFFWYVQGLGGM